MAARGPLSTRPLPGGRAFRSGIAASRWLTTTTTRCRRKKAARAAPVAAVASEVLVAPVSSEMIS